MRVWGILLTDLAGFGQKTKPRALDITWGMAEAAGQDQIWRVGDSDKLT